MGVILGVSGSSLGVVGIVQGSSWAKVFFYRPPKVTHIRGSFFWRNVGHFVEGFGTAAVGHCRGSLVGHFSESLLWVTFVASDDFLGLRRI